MYGYTTGQSSGHLQNEVEMVTTTRFIFFQRSDYNHPVWQKWNAKVKQMNVVMDNESIAWGRTRVPDKIFIPRETRSLEDESLGKN